MHSYFSSNSWLLFHQQYLKWVFNEIITDTEKCEQIIRVQWNFAKWIHLYNLHTDQETEP